MQTTKQSILSIVIGLALVAGISYAEWKGATANPPENNAPAPINVSGNTQSFVDNKTLKVKEGTGVLNLLGALKVNGILSLVDGTQGVGKVLTSDAGGMAKWATGPKIVFSHSSVVVSNGQGEISLAIGYHNYCAINYIHSEGKDSKDQTNAWQYVAPTAASLDALGRSYWKVYVWAGGHTYAQARAICFDFI